MYRIFQPPNNISLSDNCICSCQANKSIIEVEVKIGPSIVTSEVMENRSPELKMERGKLIRVYLENQGTHPMTGALEIKSLDPDPESLYPRNLWFPSSNKWILLPGTELLEEIHAPVKGWYRLVLSDSVFPFPVQRMVGGTIEGYGKLSLVERWGKR